MLNRHRIASLAAVFACAFPAPAHAQDAAASDASCREAFEESDRLLKPGSTEDLIAAREQLRACAAPTCKSWMIADCTKRLTTLGDRIPTVTFTAKDARGQSTLDVEVRLGSRVLSSKLDGRAVETNPGAQVFVCTFPDGATREVKASVIEGRQAQSLECTHPEFNPNAVTVPAPPAPVAPAPVAPALPSPAPVPAPAAAPASFPFRTVGYVALAAGGAGLVVGSIFGIKALAAKADAACDAERACEPGALSDARSSAKVSTVGFVAGAVLAASGAVLVLAFPSKASTVASSRGTRVSPWFTAGGAGIGVQFTP